MIAKAERVMPALSEYWGYALVWFSALAARAALMLGDPTYVSDGQRWLWSWQALPLVSISYWMAALCAAGTGIPSPSQALRNAPLQLVIASAVGAAVGLLTVVSDVLSPAATFRDVPSLHTTGWIAVPFYAYGAYVLTVLFHFVPIAVSLKLCQRQSSPVRTAVMSLTALAVAFSEDFRYFFVSQQDGDAIETSRHVLSVAANGSEAYFAARYGLLAALCQRGATYAVWHVVWPSVSWGGA